MLIFRQLFDCISCTYTYLLGDSINRGAIIIDPVIENVERDLSLIRELGLKLEYILDTHCHADHITGAWSLKKFTNAKIGVSSNGGVSEADIYLSSEDHLSFGKYNLQVKETPGHTSGCITFVLQDLGIAFTGDALLIRGCGRTDFQNGSAINLYRSVRNHILTLPESTKLFPGHDYHGRMSTTVAEEKKFNPRFGDGIQENDFIGYMKHLGLPHPKMIAEAVPANLLCGDIGEPILFPEWGPVKSTFAGSWELDAAWARTNMDRLFFLDVREVEEQDGFVDDKVSGVNIPLGELRDRLEELPKSKPIITVCRSGARSDLACLILRQAGFQDVANLEGGVYSWKQTK